MPSIQTIIVISKIAGAGFTGIGSLILAFRVKEIIKWVVYTIVSHENNINQLIKLQHGKHQNEPWVTDVLKHLLDIESKIGLSLLIAGFSLLSLGMLMNAFSYILQLL